MIATHVARALLLICAPSEHADAILGDLTEEYAGAHFWLVSQALRSVVPLLIARWRRGELAGLLAAAMVTILAPLRIADLLWAFVHSKIPLKAGLEWPYGFWIANLAIALAGAVILGYSARTQRTAATLTLLALICAAASVALSTGHAPLWYVVTLFTGIALAAPLVCFFETRRIAL